MLPNVKPLGNEPILILMFSSQQSWKYPTIGGNDDGVTVGVTVGVVVVVGVGVGVLLTV